MKINKLVYIEATPDEGKIFYNGEEYTDYVCILEEYFDKDEWKEVDIPEDFDINAQNIEEDALDENE